MLQVNLERVGVGVNSGSCELGGGGGNEDMY